MQHETALLFSCHFVLFRGSSSYFFDTALSRRSQRAQPPLTARFINGIALLHASPFMREEELSFNYLAGINAKFSAMRTPVNAIRHVTLLDQQMNVVDVGL